MQKCGIFAGPCQLFQTKKQQPNIIIHICIKPLKNNKVVAWYQGSSLGQHEEIWVLWRFYAVSTRKIYPGVILSIHVMLIYWVSMCFSLVLDVEYPPERRKLKFLDRQPPPPVGQRLPKMTKAIYEMRGPELIHNKLIHKQYGIRVSQTMGHVTLAAIAGTTILVPCHVAKSLQLKWRLGTSRLNKREPDLQRSYRLLDLLSPVTHVYIGKPSQH